MRESTEEKFNKLMKNQRMEKLAHVYKVHLIEKGGTVTKPIKEFNTKEERNLWMEKEGKEIEKLRGRGCLMYDEGPPEIMEIGRIEEKPKDL